VSVPSASPEVSFVVIAYNEEAHVAETIESILAQDGLSDFELIVVDDGSADDTTGEVERFAALHDEVRLIRHGENRGRGAARSTGVSAARGRFIAMVDGDIRLPEQWWKVCRAEIEHYDVVGGTAVPDGDVAFVHRWSGLKEKIVSSTTTITGNNGVYRAEVLRQVTFDDRLTEGEDIAINHAFKAAGVRLKCIDGLVVEHCEDKDFMTSVAWLFLSGTGATRQFLTYREVRGPDLAFAGWLATTLVAALQWRRPRRALGIVVAYALVTATGHLRPRFELDPHKPGALARGIGSDAVFVSAYYVGRLYGFRILLDDRALLRVSR
jgi:glycosyltransferase involved in cell wall biosynthesis